MSNLMFLYVEKSIEEVKLSAIITTGDKCEYLHHFCYDVKNEPATICKVMHNIEHLQLKYHVDAFLCADSQKQDIVSLVGSEWDDFLYPISEFTGYECLSGMSIQMLCRVLFGFGVEDDSAFGGSHLLKMCYVEIMKLKRKKKSVLSKVKSFYINAAFDAAKEVVECRETNADFDKLKLKLEYASKVFELTGRMLCI